MKYKVKLFISDYLKVGEGYETVTASRTFKFKDWDDVQNFIGYIAEGADGSVRFEIQKVDEEA